MCCGISLCCGCCSCCGRRRSQRNRPVPNGGVPYPAPAYGGYPASPQPPPYQAPQYAQFDMSRGDRGGPKAPTFNEDALPPMPSWNAAPERRIIVEEPPPPHQDVELARWDSPAARTPAYPPVQVHQPNPGPYGYQEATDRHPAPLYPDPNSSPGLSYLPPRQQTTTPRGGYGDGGDLSPLQTTSPAYMPNDQEVSPISPQQIYPSPITHHHYPAGSTHSPMPTGSSSSSPPFAHHQLSPYSPAASSAPRGAYRTGRETSSIVV